MVLEQEQLLFGHQEYLPGSLGLFQRKQKNLMPFYKNTNLTSSLLIYMLFCPKTNWGKDWAKHTNQTVTPFVAVSAEMWRKRWEEDWEVKTSTFSAAEEAKLRSWATMRCVMEYESGSHLPRTALPVRQEPLQWIFALSCLEIDRS